MAHSGLSTTIALGEAERGEYAPSYTRIGQNHAAPAMRAMVLQAMDSMKWRHHGIGVLQGYVSEDADPEVRVHVWSRRLLKSGMDLSGDAHDHRFDMVSHVLCGTVAHEELTAEAALTGDHAMLALTHARAAADNKFHGPTEELPGTYRVLRNLLIIDAGYTYTFPALHFHRSPLAGDGVAVTVVEKHRQQEDVRARILYPTAHQPVMAFGHDMDQALIASVLAEAKAALRGSAGTRCGAE
jgi:hypothetical protein